VGRLVRQVLVQDPRAVHVVRRSSSLSAHFVAAVFVRHKSITFCSDFFEHRTTREWQSCKNF
jgi:hypothetical protein